VLGLGFTAYDIFADGNVSVGDLAKGALAIFTLASPVGWVYGLVDLGTMVITGTSITDRISNTLDRHLDPIVSW
jgi:hypothetical protein